MPRQHTKIHTTPFICIYSSRSLFHSFYLYHFTTLQICSFINLLRSNFSNFNNFRRKSVNNIIVNLPTSRAKKNGSNAVFFLYLLVIALYTTTFVLFKSKLKKCSNMRISLLNCFSISYGNESEIETTNEFEPLNGFIIYTLL